MTEASLPPSLPAYNQPQGPKRASVDQAKPLMKMLGRMMSKRIKLPHGKVASQSIKIKDKKVKYW